MWTYHNPVSIHAGSGSLAQLPALLAGRHALLVTFPEAAALGLEQSIANLLGAQLAGTENAVQPNPDVSWLSAMHERVWSEHAEAQCVVAFGGGSVIDCAKAMLASTPSGRFDELLAHLRDGAPLAAGRAKALIAIPTTAGTGSEVTPWATLWDAAAGSKYSLHRDWTWPEAAIIDPKLMLSLPPGATLASGLDALSHALEAIWNVNRNPVSSSLAAAAARAIVATLPLLMRKPADLALRERMAIAALQAGLAFSNTKTALAHSLSYDITLHHGIAHGIACSFSLPHVMRLAFGRDAQVDTLLLQIFGAADRDGAVARLSGLLENLGVSTDPAHYGIADAWDTLVQRALQGPRGRNFIAAVH
ncbi:MULTISPECIES: iron-containing alcohol dehydrogenase PsrA [unclassified Herbaspirillum]|uniref:iron-containing alcohol dehydrogenase PsrA n=1 Tax=unclassified Herbaspirillum TaxID=2624150 RepID=UPI001150A75D|nr:MULTISPECIES: iron-containing alcohol dehydrogenase PsrA [unclassified Herbaspirillum]MBB5393408.1 phosphonate metabolism-associated iron-containing alcohol dehydrogenase [Herbaspirillum sp. SJZ102]TQK03844.1 phosphonate metabolism-associated iron-containing alcohol dehydrogenase [Herbaspirillum sp. SJZ130]TQK08576.1 phosphonate metabolism-associated iron-containing alcohol dehydrogenase [Herbaspirillum sp. SJZ106]